MSLFSGNFREPNAHIDFASGPFVVNSETRAWPQHLQPRRAGVSAFGVGGTNVHVVLGQAQPATVRKARARSRIVPVSARNPADFTHAVERLADALTDDVPLADVEHTCARGRVAFEYRRAIVASSREQLLAQLRAAVPVRAADRVRVRFFAPPISRSLNGIGRDLFAHVPHFKRVVKECVDSVSDPTEAQWLLESFGRTQTPATSGHVVALRTFIFQYAFGRLLMDWGVMPDALLGVDVGHLVSGTLAGSLTLTDGLSLARALAPSDATRRAMLVALSERQLLGMLPSSVELIAVCAPEASVVAGPVDAIDAWRRMLRRSGIASRSLGPMPSTLSNAKTTERTITCQRPRVPVICPETGALLPSDRAEDPRYWESARPRVVRVNDALDTAARDGGVWLELGSGSVLAGLIRKNHLDRLDTLPGLRVRRAASEAERVLAWIGALWERGANVEWRRVLDGRDGRVCSLPTYPFASTRHWIDAPAPAPADPLASSDRASLLREPTTNGSAHGAGALSHQPIQAPEVPPKRADVATWFYTPAWQPWTIPAPRHSPASRWLLFVGDDDVSVSLEEELRTRGHQVITVRESSAYVRLGPRNYRLRPGDPADYITLITDVLTGGSLDGVVHAWTMGEVSELEIADRIDEEHTRGVHSLIGLMQALGRANVTAPLRLGIVSNNTQAVVGRDLTRPEQASLKGAAKIIPQEYPNVRCVHVDVERREPFDRDAAQALAAILDSDSRERFVARRAGQWLRESVESVGVPGPERMALREHGVYLITGGLGGVGLTIAEHLAREARARLVLLGRVGVPPRSVWDQLSRENGSQGDVVRRLQRIESLGGVVHIASADLTDHRRVQRVIEEAEAHTGPIQGVIHAAAEPDMAGVMQRRTRAATERSMAAKIRGALILERVFRGRSLDFFVLCSALGATVYNLKFGEVGYVAANDFLNAFAHHLRDRGVPATAIAWTDWQDVGMGAEALKRLGQAREELAHVEHPVWEHRTRVDGHPCYTAAIQPAARWLFYGHTIAGRPTLPGAALPELIASAFRLETNSAGCEIRGLYIHAPVALEIWQRAQLRLSLNGGPDNARCELTLAHPDGSETTHATGIVGRLPGASAAEPVPLDAIRQRCTQTRRIAADTTRPTETGIELDARWDAIREVWIGDGEGLARVELDEQFHGELRDYRWHPALLDSAIAFLNHVVAGTGPAFMPLGYERIRVWAPLAPALFSHGRWQVRADRAGELLQCDVTICDAAGQTLLEIEGLTARRLAPALRASTDARVVTPLTHRLAVGRPGALSTLGFQPIAAPDPPPGQVEIEVMAAGVNFKEVLTALGLMSQRLSFGLECAGRVTRIGANVTRVAPGDAVMVFGVGWTMPLACVPEEWLEVMPAALTFEAAATAPVAFTVAYHALVHLACLQPEHSLLIHAACGGVGLAAIQIARRIGCRIVATAGSDAKRSYLREHGIEHVSDSRSPAFLDAVLGWTNGRGVDVVLNSLSGELLDASFKALATQGKLVELGRRDLFENRPIGLQLLAKGVQFLPVTTDARDAELATAWREVARLLREGELTPLPYRTFGTSRIAEAFEMMSRGEHIGKLVIVPDGDYPGVPAEPRSRRDDEIQALRTLVHGMTPTEGVEVFRRAVASGRPEVLVSTQDLPAMLQQQEVVSELGHQAFWTARVSAASASSAEAAEAIAPVATNGALTRELDIPARLRDIWRELLGVKEIRPDDDFFDLGGDSLVAIRLIERLHEVFEVEQSLANIFDVPTFGQLAEWIATTRGHAASTH